MKLSSGVNLDSILGMSEELTLSGGYDARIECSRGGLAVWGNDEQRPFTEAERREIADYMIELWQKWREVKPAEASDEG